MVHTFPDYTTKYKMVKVFSQIDSGELAARLGSINTFDRRGNIVWMDDFEDTATKWGYSLTGGRGSIVTSNARAWTGDQSMQIVTGAQVDDMALMEKYFSLLSDTRLGLELRVTRTGSNSMFYMGLYGDNGTNQYNGTLRWNWSNGHVDYRDSGGGWPNLKDDVLMDITDEHWLPLKVVIDWDNLEYVRALVEDQEYDLTGEALSFGATSGNRFILIWIWLIVSGAVSKDCWIDNVILTQNEP